MSSDSPTEGRRGAIRARLSDITEGPWYVDDEEMTVRAKDYNGEILFDRSGERRSYWREHGKPNAEFIANAPQDLERMLSATDELDDLVKEWEDMARGTTQFDATLRVCAFKVREILRRLDD